jgi:hypothetical protein
MQRRQTINLLAIFVLIAMLFAGPLIPAARAGVDDVLFGVVSSQDMVDFSAINASNFADTFTYSGDAVSSLTIGGQVEAQIGAIYTGGSQGQWHQIRVVIDSNGDGDLTPFDWSDPSHPWNPDIDNPSDGDSWQYTYPDDYPRSELRGETVTVTWNAACYCTDFPWNTWEQWWYEGSADKTDNWWMDSGQLMSIWWSGRDQNWNTLPNGDYKVQVWVDENDDGQFGADEANKTMIITIQTAGITGTVEDGNGDPIVGARVEAGSWLAWGETRTRSDGTFTVSGLQAGAGYHLRVQSTGKVTYETDIQLADGETTADAGTLTMSNAVTISGTIKLDRDADGNTDEAEDQFAAFTNQWGWEQNDLWVWVDGHNTQGPGWGNADARFAVGDNAISFSINIPPPASSTNYRLNVHTEGYVATINGQPVSGVDIPVTSSGGNAGTIVLTKASRLNGTVRLPETVDGWTHIDVQAISSADSDERYWGWGSIDPWQNGGDGSPTDTGQFAIDGIPAGTYRLEVRVMGFAAHITDNVVVTQGQDKEMGQLTISEGSKITGMLSIADTTNLQRWYGDNNQQLDIWIDAWSRSGGWSGTSVRVTRGAAQQVSYSLAGLTDATYEINCWLGEGYELVDGNGNSPVMVTVNGQTTANLQLKAFEGVVRGTISGNGISIDLSKVVVEVKRPWDWLPPKMATVANGGINAATGAYQVSGLGTGDYVVKAGLYNGFIGEGDLNSDLSQYQGDANLIPDASVGVSMQRTFVQNNASNPTTLNLLLERGYSITGTVFLSQVDPPWHDFGDGVYDSDTQSFGDPDGRKNTNANGLLSEAIGMVEDIAGQPVMAMPMDMMFMGGQDPRMGFIQYDSGTGLATYRIDGLAPGVYMLQPPFNSRRISQYTDDGSDGSFMGPQGDQDTHHWTATTRMVVITDQDMTDQDFTFANGYTVTGQLTLPEAQTYSQDWEAWNWVGHLELETPQHQFMGHGKPLMKRDFAQGSRYSFTFNHVANGDYLVRFWTDRYVPGGTKFTVNNASASVNLTIEAGANLVGKLVDAVTGEAVTADDGVMVRCEAVPHVEGSWRETRDDMWSQSYIEDGGDLQSSGSGGGDSGGEGSSRTNNTPGKFHLTALPTGHKYIVVVETTNGKKTDGAKNYVGRVIAGIEIPEGASGDINVGTIKLTEGTTIKGRLTDANGYGIPGVDVIAMPSNTHDGSAEAEGVSDTQGYFTIYGINPDVAYYDLIAAERPDMFEDWGKQVQWGEKRKYNVAPNTTDANFVLIPATASLSGTLTIPGGSQFMIPFRDEASDFPATIILLQRKGVIYKDVLDGIEVMSAPAPEGATTTTYTIDHIAPGKFKAIFMNYGLPTKIVDNIEIADGDNSLNMTWASAGYTVSGDVALADGGYPSSADISGAICMNTTDQSLIFGQLTQEADGTYSGYEVPGLASGSTYQLVFFRESGFDGPPEIFTAGSPFTVSGNIADNTAVITRESEPVLMAQAVVDSSDSSKVNIGIFSTAYLNDDSISVVGTAPSASSTGGEIYVSGGAGSLSSVILSGDKRSISVTYTKGSGDTTVVLTLAVHYGDDDTTFLQNLSFNVNSLAKNEDSVSIYIPGQVKLGNGDASQIYVPAGALDTSDDGAAIVSIEKSDELPGTLAEAPRDAVLSRGIFARSATVPLPDDSTAAGNQYEFNITAVGSGASVTQTGKVTVQIQYDPNLTEAEIENLQVKHLVNGQWVTETTNRTVDTDNYTISVEVDSLSPFIAAVVQSDSGDSGGGDTGGDAGTGDSAASSGGGSSGGCFISSTASESEIGGSHLPTGIILVTMMLGLGLALHLTIKRSL